MRISDGESYCTLPDANGGTTDVQVVEIGEAGAHLQTTADFELNAYLDLTLVLKGQPPRNLFASVASCGELGLKIAWMHIDPGERKRVKELLEGYRATIKAGATKTRRIVKPGSLANSPEFTPFGDPEAAAEAGTNPAPADGAKKLTRRIVKPRAETAESTDSVASSEPAYDPLDDSKAHAVVLAPTEKFARLKDEDAARLSASLGTLVPAAQPEANPPLPDPEGSGVPAAENKRMVVGSDGRMDIGASIRSRAKTVRASELAARHDRVRVLNMATIKSLIQEAVEEAANHLTRALGAAERKRLLEEAEEGFKERLKAFEAEKLSADVRAQRLQEQFESAQRLLEDERKRAVTADQFTVSAKGMEDIESVFRRLIDRSVADGKLDPGLEEQLRKVAAHVLDSERELMRAKEMGAQNDKIELLEKKLKRLATNLEETERQRDEAREIAQHLEQYAGQGLSIEQIKSKYRIGLGADDPNRERKLAMMKEIIDQNREVRKALGLTINAPEPVAAKAAVVVAPEPVAEQVAEAAEATADEPTADDGVPIEDPDDMVWTPDTVITPKEEKLEGAGHKLSTFKNFEPPPLQQK